MAVLPPDQRSSWTELFLFLAKVVGMLAAIFAFGFLIFWMRRATL